ncbi:Uncharacterised protein [Mycobacteroides abscessus subsp. abscessus]|nr:Uncharacterised protein [Mycobacteroides abscessus subsp. abscessus]
MLRRAAQPTRNSRWASVNGFGSVLSRTLPAGWPSRSGWKWRPLAVPMTWAAMMPTPPEAPEMKTVSPAVGAIARMPAIAVRPAM